MVFIHLSILVAKSCLYSHERLFPGWGCEVLDLVLPEALPRVRPREPSFQLELKVMTDQAEHPLGQCMRRGTSSGRPRSGRPVVGKAGVKEAPQEQVTRSVTGRWYPGSWAAPSARPLGQVPGSRPGPGTLGLPIVGRRKPCWPALSKQMSLSVCSVVTAPWPFI